MAVRVDTRASLSLVGSVLKYLAVPLCFPLLVALYYGESVAPFLATIALTVTVGVGLQRLDPDPDLRTREGLLMVSLTWAVVAVVGAVPYLIEAHGLPMVVAPPHPESTLGNPVNALFESTSGFTTTGATVLGSIDLETHTRSIMLWRQLTQWLGGMGIVVLAVAILPELSVGGAQLMDAEAPGPGIEKLTPRIAETARALWGAYLGLTVLEAVLLYSLSITGVDPGMTLYNAVAHALTTMPTGGFSPEARSIEAFSAAAQWIIIPFMIAAGTNFALFWHVLTGDRTRLFRDSEFKFYLGVLAVITAVLASILFTGGFATGAPAGGTYDAAYLETVRGDIVGHVEPALRHALFQAAALVTTTGYASMDFNAWGPAAKGVLFFAMFIGGSAGSTGGAVKIVRWYVILKSVRRELFTTAHPEAVRPVRLGGNPIDERALRGIYGFTFLYLAIFVASAILLFLDAQRVGLDVSVLEMLSTAATAIGNVGPAFGQFGPMGGYLSLSEPSKLYVVFLMWIGRLEIFPVLVLLTPEYWRR
ncbi:TrkH family potassium uptake protein [Halobellus litoreus]|uniref:TrkH family potassium uptake protein n=1 Tax=Halobellus litoreus TaxID=755310 RepID=A0ABD6DQY6_9EURY|nr:TrkH family potassium uptake protein [Halobellus litoreus]